MSGFGCCSSFACWAWSERPLVWNAARVWTEGGRSWWAKTSVTGIMIALLTFVWFVVSLQLVSPSLND